MKKRLIKIFSGLLLGVSLFSVPAYANEYSGWRTNTIFYSGDPMIVYADSSHWEERYDYNLKRYYWVCATPDFHQGYANTWVSTNGKWYYIGDDGKMKNDILVGKKEKKERYLLDSNGAMLTNTYWEQFGHSNYIDNNGLVYLPDIYYDMMPR